MKTNSLQIFQNPDDLILPLVLMFVILVLSIIITRAVFSISKFLKYQKANTYLIISIAKLKGVSEDEIQAAIDIISPREEGRYINEYSIRKIYEATEIKKTGDTRTIQNIIEKNSHI